MLPEMYSRGREPNIAPKELLKLIRFQCHATTDRCDGRCSCKLANIKCTAFCGCHDDGVFCVRYSSEDILDGRDDTYDDISDDNDNDLNLEDSLFDTDMDV